jgi:hypothetical protein
MKDVKDKVSPLYFSMVPLKLDLVLFLFLMLKRKMEKGRKVGAKKVKKRNGFSLKLHSVLLQSSTFFFLILSLHD